jgi:citrate lyase beta subunit
MTAGTGARLRALRRAEREHERRNPGPPPSPQPSHTVYLPADRFDAGAAAEHGRLALAALVEHAPDAETLAAATGVAPAHAAEVRRRVAGRLALRPVEDLRIDFEDGLGPVPDATEDDLAHAAGREIARAAGDGLLPPGIGVRVRPLGAATRERSLRTLHLVLSAVAADLAGPPPTLAVTLPKVIVPEQIALLAAVLAEEEARLGWAEGTLRLEAMVEVPEAVLGPDGASPLRRWIAAAAGRLAGVHLGVHDYTAALGIPTPLRGIRHPACDLARQVMQVALAGTGVHVSDGSTARLPVGARDAVHRGWRLHAEDVRHALRAGIHQGWDLHPAQLVSRWTAVYGFHREGLDGVLPALGELRARPGDDPHARSALEDFCARAIACGAADADEVERAIGR